MKMIVKRNGEIVPFDKERIVRAIHKAMVETENNYDISVAKDIADQIEKLN